MFERWFEVLFKYRPVVFQSGELAFSPPLPGAVAVTVVVAAAAVAVWFYVRRHPDVGVPLRGALLAVRLAAVGLLGLLLLRPMLVVRAVEPQRNIVAVLIDDSRSMALQDGSGPPRGQFVREALSPSSGIRLALDEKFSLRFYRFSRRAERLADPEAVAFDGTRSDVGRALRQVADELAGLPTSGIVLMSDGADTTAAAASETIGAVRAAGLPVFAVGLGGESIDRDIQMGTVELPRTVLKGATVVVDLAVHHSGFDGRQVSIEIEDEGRPVASLPVTLPADARPAVAQVSFTLAEAGPRVLSVRVPVQPGERISANNTRHALVRVDDRRERILYVEGEPRPEMKFLRQAVRDDRQLQVVTLQRTAARKFLRLDIDRPDELAGHFPQTRDELFAYRGLVLGSIEAAAFTPDQLRMMADFVNVRGAGLLALGGRSALAEGGYAGTPVAEALPVALEPPVRDAVRELRVRPTRDGLIHPVTQVNTGDGAAADRWKDLPPLTSVNPVRRAKPGATVLLEGDGVDGSPAIVLASQRYGAGRTIVLPVQDTWLWQMHADMPVEDLTHELLWRRLLRWLVDGVPDRVNVITDRDRVEPGEVIGVTATVRDAGFVGVNDASVAVTLTAPSGAETRTPARLAAAGDGEYVAQIAAHEPGVYDVRVEATRGGQPMGTSQAYVRAAPDDAELFDAARRTAWLTRVAEDTGGRFYTAATAASLADDMTYLGRGLTVVHQKDLWDMPAALVLLVALLGGEWVLRRRWGLA